VSEYSEVERESSAPCAQPNAVGKQCTSDVYVFQCKCVRVPALGIYGLCRRGTVHCVGPRAMCSTRDGAVAVLADVTLAPRPAAPGVGHGLGAPTTLVWLPQAVWPSERLYMHMRMKAVTRCHARCVLPQAAVVCAHKAQAARLAVSVDGGFAIT